MKCEHCFRERCFCECPTDEDVAECAECGELIKEDEPIYFCLTEDDSISQDLDTENYDIRFFGDVEGYPRGATLCEACAEKIRRGEI